jgi:uncharacterized protein YceK
MPPLVQGDMLMIRTARAAVLVLAAFLSGCGTLANLSGQGWERTRIYGGVLGDVKSAGDWIDNNPISAQTDILKDVGTVVGVALVGLDVPLSAIGDTVTLPVTIPVTIWKSTRASSSVSQKPPAAPAAVSQKPPVAPAATKSLAADGKSGG